VTASAVTDQTRVLRDGRRVLIRRAEPDDAATILAYLGRVGGETVNLTFGAEGPGFSEEEEREYLARVSAADNSLAILALAGDEIVGMLNEYFSSMVDLVFKHGGTLDKFVGDMVMALYGAPLDDPDHADHAVQTALAMITELGRLNARWKEEGRISGLDIGIGINTGPMIAGNIGSEAIMSYTVIGDAVNLGSRLESLNKEFGTRIIISDATRQRLKGNYEFRPLGDVVVKGKTHPVAIFEVVGLAATASGMNREARV